MGKTRYIHAENVALFERARREYGLAAYDVMADKRHPSGLHGLYRDPDGHDFNLYREYASYLGDGWHVADCKRPHLEHPRFPDIWFTLDALCGWKQLANELDRDVSAWLPEYDLVRKSLAGHLCWPAYKNDGGLTVNQARYSAFSDCVDYVLNDIKRFYEHCREGWEAEDSSFKRLELVRNHCVLANPIEAKPERYDCHPTLQFLDAFETFKEAAIFMKWTPFLLELENGAFYVKDLHGNPAEPLNPGAKNCMFTRQYWENVSAILKTPELGAPIPGF